MPPCLGWQQVRYSPHSHTLPRLLGWLLSGGVVPLVKGVESSSASWQTKCQVLSPNIVPLHRSYVPYRRTMSTTVPANRLHAGNRGVHARTRTADSGVRNDETARANIKFLMIRSWLLQVQQRYPNASFFRPRDLTSLSLRRTAFEPPTRAAYALNTAANCARQVDSRACRDQRPVHTYHGLGLGVGARERPLEHVQINRLVFCGSLGIGKPEVNEHLRARSVRSAVCHAHSAPATHTSAPFAFRTSMFDVVRSPWTKPWLCNFAITSPARVAMRSRTATIK